MLENSDDTWHLAIPRLEDLAAGEREQVAAELAALIPLPGGVELRLHQNTADERFVVLPPAPEQTDALSDEELMQVVGGGNGGNGGAGGAYGGLFGGNGGNGGNGAPAASCTAATAARGPSVSDGPAPAGVSRASRASGTRRPPCRGSAGRRAER